MPFEGTLNGIVYIRILEAAKLEEKISDLISCGSLI
jgi:hypothetical protein